MGQKDPKNVTGIKIKNLKKNSISDLKVDGLFIAIGHDPATSLFKGQLDMDKDNFRLTIESEKNHDIILQNTNELIDKGGYGSPTMVVENQIFFGNDRMNLVEFAIGLASGKVLVLPGQHNA